MPATTVRKTSAAHKTGGAQANLLTDYWKESRRPLVSLVFVAPILLTYEAGMLIMGPHAMRNGADVWLRHMLEWTGFGQYFLLPILTSLILLAWHHITGQQWRFRWSAPQAMVVESILLGLLLLVVAQLQNSLFASIASAQACATSTGGAGATIARLVSYCGAGIYEELLFRLMLLPCAIAALRLVGVTPRVSVVTAVIVLSLVFSAAHYQLFASMGDPFDWFSFTFRFLAGIFFSLLFLYRGFGIAVGTHALYDVFVVIL